MPKPSRQTVSYLMRRFQEIGLQPDSKHGQNFLIDMNLLELLARSAKLNSNDVVLEVGTGTGSLTGIMAEQAAQVVTIEIDSHLYQLAQEELEELENIEFIHRDALKNKNKFAPEVIEAIERHLKADSNRQFKLAANLPYNVATPIMSNLLLWEHPPVMMTATIQKELAERMVAKPSTKDYGSLSVWIQSQCYPEIVRIMSPKVFWPRPKVESAIVRIVRQPHLCERIPDLKFFHQFVRSMFFHRRKFLRAVLVAAFKQKLTKSEVDEVMGKMELGSDVRAEQMDVDAILQLSHLFRQRVGSFE